MGNEKDVAHEVIVDEKSEIWALIKKVQALEARLDKLEEWKVQH